MESLYKKTLAEILNIEASKLNDIIDEEIEQIFELQAQSITLSLQKKLNEIVTFEEEIEKNYINTVQHHWGECFKYSVALYSFTIEKTVEFHEYIRQEATTKPELQTYSYLVFQALHGRICHIYLEIITLLKAGLAEGAFARLRSMLEILAISYFIYNSKQKNKLAEAYYNSKESFSNGYAWARFDERFSDSSKIHFNKILEYSMIKEEFGELYSDTCKVIHAESATTFYRLLGSSNPKNVISIEPSKFGIALPAMVSAQILYRSTALYLQLCCNKDTLLDLHTLCDWCNLLKKKYNEFEDKIK